MKLITPLCLALCISAYSQVPSTGAATAKGNCNFAVTGSGNTINIKACGTDEAAELRKFLKNITANQKLDTATILKKLDECLQTMADRHLTPAQKELIVARVSPFSGHKISINVPLGNSEAKSYGMDFVAVFRKAQWTGVEQGGVSQSVAGGNDPVGIQVTVNEADAKAGKVPPDAVTLLNTLAELGLVEGKTMFVNPQIISGETELRIGVKATRH